MSDTRNPFVLTYGFFRYALPQKDHSYRLTQKAACFEENAEIYRIGYTQYDGAFRQDIYVLIWENRVIPFLVNTKQITEKIFPSKATIPVVSVLVYDIGKDLKKMQPSRENYVTYHKDFFSDQATHGHEFLYESEYSKAKELIRDGVSVLLPDNDTFKLPAEIIFGTGPWNLRPDLYRAELEQENAFYGSVYRKVLWIRWLLDTMAKKELKTELLRLKKQRKKYPEFRKAYDRQMSIHNSAKKTARQWMKDLKQNVRSVEDFMQFCLTHPEPRDSGNGRDIIQDGENQKYFFALLAASENPVLGQFQDFENQLVKQALESIEKYIPAEDNSMPYLRRIERLEDELKSKACDGHISIETIMRFLIGRELPFSADYKTDILKNPWFLDILRNTYHEKYQDICSGFEDFLVSITEIMVQRSIYRKFTLLQNERT